MAAREPSRIRGRGYVRQHDGERCRSEGLRPDEGRHREYREQYHVVGERQQQQVEQRLECIASPAEQIEYEPGRVAQQHAQSAAFPARTLGLRARTAFGHVAAHCGAVGEYDALPMPDEQQVVFQER